MANLGRFKIEAKADGSWTDFTTLATITRRCVIQNLYNACVVCEKATEPTKNEGFIVPKGARPFQFNPITTLWVKPFNTEDYVELNVSD